MLDVLDSEYIKMARIKGVPEYLVILKHGFRNAMIPVITLAALNIVTLLNGTVITETVFNWPGIGRLIVDSIFARDYPMVQTCVLIASGAFYLHQSDCRHSLRIYRPQNQISVICSPGEGDVKFSTR